MRYCRGQWHRPTHKIYTVSSLNAARVQVRRAAALLHTTHRAADAKCPVHHCHYSSSREPATFVFTVVAHHFQEEFLLIVLFP